MSHRDDLPQLVLGSAFLGDQVLATEKSNQASRRVIKAINELQSEGAAINFNTISVAARVSKTFLYDPKHSDLAQQIRLLRQVTSDSVHPGQPA